MSPKDLKIFGLFSLHGMCDILFSGTETETLSESGVDSGVPLGVGVVIARDENRANIARTERCIL